MKKLYLLVTVLVAATTFANAQQQIVAPPGDIDTTIFTKVDKVAQFPGGLQGWGNYLRNNLKAELASKYIELPKKQSEARQTVRIGFIVNKDGKVSNLFVQNKNEVHPKLAAEALRVIQAGPDWIPAEQNGRKVNYHVVQPIIFLVTRD